MPLLAPDTLMLDGRFRVLSALGSGAMGDVYVAEQLSLGRRVALKILRQDLSSQPGMAERFAREARLLSSVDHPSVVRVIDYGQSEAGACLVMELAEGQTLKQALNGGPLPPERAQHILIQLARGLIAIHARGIIHRDIKPENVMLANRPEGEQARLLDFGIARLAEPGGDANLTQSGMLIGTPHFLSPEQALGKAPDVRTDLYSLGVTAYQMLSGTLPFHGDTVRELMAQHIHTAPPPLSDTLPGLTHHTGLCQLVMQCLEKDPAARPQSAADLLTRLEGGTLPVAAQLAKTKISPLASARKLAHRLEGPVWAAARKPRVVAAAAAVLVFALALGTIRAFAPPEAARLLDDGRPREALAKLESSSDKIPLPLLVSLKAAALHQLKRHPEETELLLAQSPATLGELDPRIADGLAAHCSRESPELPRRIPRAWLRKALLPRTRGEPSPEQWRLVDCLDDAEALDRSDILELSIAALRAKQCNIRSEAARRLGELGDSDALDELELLTKEPLAKTLGIFPVDCGQAEAARARGAIQSKSQ